MRPNRLHPSPLALTRPTVAASPMSAMVTAFLAVLCLLTPPAHAGVIQVGGSYTVAVSNSPGSLSATPVTLDGSVHSLTTSAGTLNLQALIHDVDVNNQWLEFVFSTPNGILASNVNANWQWTISNIPLSQPALLMGVFYYWSIDGVAVDPIHDWAGGVLFPGGGTNPITGVGKGFGGIGAPGPIPTNNTFFVNPYKLLGDTGLANEGDMPYLQINDFHFAFRLTAANPVPEPSSLVSAALGLAALAGHAGWRRGRRACG